MSLDLLFSFCFIEGLLIARRSALNALARNGLGGAVGLKTAAFSKKGKPAGENGVQVDSSALNDL